MARQVTFSGPVTTWIARQSLLLLVPAVIMTLRVLNFDPTMTYYRIADIDSLMPMQALDVNGGGIPSYLDHPGDAPIRLLGWWFSFLFWVGGLGFKDLSGISSPAIYVDTLFAGTVAGRILAALIMVGAVHACAFASYLLTRRLWVGVYSGCLYAAGYGTFLQSQVIRTESLSALLWWISVILIILLARPTSRLRYALSAGALGACLYLQLSSKVQSLLMFPFFLVVPFLVQAIDRLEQREREVPKDRDDLPLWSRACLAVLTGALLADASLFFRVSVYHLAVVSSFVVFLWAMNRYANRGSFLTLVLLVVAGSYVGTLLHSAPYTAYPLYTSVNAQEKLQDMCNLGKCPTAELGTFVPFVKKVLKNTWSTLFSLDETQRPYLVTKLHCVFAILWLMVTIGLVAWRANVGKVRETLKTANQPYAGILSVQAVLLLLVALVTSAMLFRWARGELVSYYWLYVEAGVVLAMAIPLVMLSQLKPRVAAVIFPVFILGTAIPSIIWSDHAWRRGKASGLPTDWIPSTGCSWSTHTPTTGALVRRWGGCENVYESLAETSAPR